MDPRTPELIRVFSDELDERSGRLIEGARRLAGRALDAGSVADLVRDAHTIKGSAGLMGYEAIRQAARRLEEMWRSVADDEVSDPEMAIRLETLAGRLRSAMEEPGESALLEYLNSLDSDQRAPVEPVEEVIPLRPTGVESLGGLLATMSDSLLSGATRVDTADLYRLINRIVEVALDAEAMADLSLVSIEGADPDRFRQTWRIHLERLSESIGDIQRQAVSLANVSFFEATSTFPQFVRYLGRRSNKDVRFELTGHDVQLDRQIVDLIREPIRHLLVNAVDHGIEPAADRVARGKPSTGVVRVSARVVDEQVKIAVADDGAGVDWDLVVERARPKNITITPGDLTPVLFEPGFSTLGQPTEFSGTGEGLPAALEAVAQVHGAISIDSVEGSGTTVTMTLPMSMVLQRVVVVTEGDRFWGIPEASVEASMPLANAEMTTHNNESEVRFESAAIPCVSLSRAVGAEGEEDANELVVVSTRSGLVAVTVSEIIDRRRVAVKNLGPILEGSGAINGAALLGGGQILIVLDPDFLGLAARSRPRLVSDRPKILVVDDSAGVRQLLSATLIGAGFEVEVASGAREAMLNIAGDGYAAMVVDYSMPRSNGVELVRAMRAADIRVPIVMVSGVAEQEEKDAAWQAGVDAYLDKFDLRHGVLTKTLRQLLGMDEANSA